MANVYIIGKLMSWTTQYTSKHALHPKFSGLDWIRLDYKSVCSKGGLYEAPNILRHTNIKVTELKKAGKNSMHFSLNFPIIKMGLR